MSFSFRGFFVGASDRLPERADGLHTKQIHAGVTPDPVSGSILTPIYQATTFVQESVDQYLSKGYSYSRSGNPTVRALEQKLTVLEERRRTARCYSTGMAAEQAVLQALLSAGDHAVVSDVAYGGTYRLCTKILSRFGVEFTFADTSNPDAVRKALRPNTKLIFTETPANPTLKLTDIAAVSEIARSRGIPHAVDNTFLTPYFQRPLELGANISVHSTTKYFDGHNATVGGAVIVDDAELGKKIRFVQNATGVIMSPFVAWLTLQGTKTLSVRLERQSANAQAIAEFLESHPKVTQVRYPGLESFPQHALAKKQASGFGAHAVVRGRGRSQGRQEAHGLGEAVHARRELGLGRDADHASGHDDARRRRARRAQTRRDHGRSRPALGRPRGRRGLIADLKSALDKL